MKSTTDLKILGERLKTILKANRVTEDELAERIGKSKSTISAYCTGRAFPSIETVISIAEHLHVSIDFLLGLSDKETIGAGLSSNAATKLSQLPRKKYFSACGLDISNSIFTSEDFMDCFNDILEYVHASNEFVKSAVEAAKSENKYGDIDISNTEIINDINNSHLADLKEYQAVKHFSECIRKLRNQKFDAATEYFYKYHPLYHKKTLTSEEKNKAKSLLRQLKEE